MLVQHTDERGTFVELIKNEGGQVSFSTSLPGVTRGNHWHERKHEKFIVVAGNGVITLRQVGQAKTTTYSVNGNHPMVVDIEPLHVHNITNTGNTPLYLVVWCNEIFDANDPDTYAERV